MKCQSWLLMHASERSSILNAIQVLYPANNKVKEVLPKAQTNPHFPVCKVYLWSSRRRNISPQTFVGTVKRASTKGSPYKNHASNTGIPNCQVRNKRSFRGGLAETVRDHIYDRDDRSRPTQGYLVHPVDTSLHTKMVTTCWQTRTRYELYTKDTSDPTGKNTRELVRSAFI